MTELQREANRDFTPTIADIMHIVYDICTNEHGPGSYKRMKEHMQNHVERERYQMFEKATRTVERHLGLICKSLQTSMETKSDEIFLQMSRDYLHVLGGVALNQAAMPPVERRANFAVDVRDILHVIDAQFEPIASGKLDTSDGVQNEGSAVAADDPVIIDERGLFESAQESVDGAANEDSSMEGANDTMLTEPTPDKRTAKDVDMGGMDEVV